MTYMHCPRCRLAIHCRAPYLTLTHCPRCLARAAIATPLFASALNGHELRARQATHVVSDVGQLSARLQDVRAPQRAQDSPRRAP